jgi:hypothetical protein
VQGRAVDEPRFFLSADCSRMEAQFPADGAQERLAVRGFAHRGGRHREDGVHLVGVGQLLVPAERDQRSIHRLAGQAPVRKPVAEPDHLLLAADDMAAPEESASTITRCSELLPMSTAARRVNRIQSSAAAMTAP